MKKKTILTLLISCLSLFVLAQASSKLDENNGFKDYKFGDKLKGYLKMKKFSDSYFVNDQNVLRIPAKDLSIGDIPVKYVDLYFIDSLLSKIEVFLPVQYNNDLLTACKNVFGTPDSMHYKSDTSGKKEDIPDMIVSETYWHGAEIKLSFSDLSKKFYTTPEKDSPLYKKLTVKLVYELKNYQELLAKKKDVIIETKTKSDF
ncbi:MAG: hypothetical protein WCL14_08020 [Bacteroidota bacterium]